MLDRKAALVVCIFFLATPSAFTQVQKDTLLTRVHETAKSVSEQIQEARKAIRYFEDDLSELNRCSGYSTADVDRTLDKAKEQVLDGLSGDELAPLRSYVKEFYPPSISMSPPDSCVISGGYGKAIKVAAKGELVSEAFRRIYSLLDKLSSLKRIAVDFTVASNPTGASFRITPSAGGQGRFVVTDSTIRNLYRGYYVYEVKKDGFKTVTASLNLVDEEPSKLACSLHRVESSEGPNPCRIE